ncbi:MAG TPA: DUF2490 domain-containing protein, partial [Muricauda sp.]|nr:DUF2490 domain-containing protein [Allomuricauda sp.]
MIKRLTGLFLFLGILTINAQQPGEDEMGAWYMYFGTNKISERLSIHT